MGKNYHSREGRHGAEIEKQKRGKFQEMTDQSPCSVLKLSPRVSYYGGNEKAECIEDFSLVSQLEWHVNLRVFVQRRGKGASVMESLHKLVFFCPPVSQPDIKRLPFVFWDFNSEHLFLQRAVLWGSRNAMRNVADRHIFSDIKSSNVHVDSWRRNPIKENRSQSVI
jgi:hypothetical protein